jgi:predicted Zn-dependent peptidase
MLESYMAKRSRPCHPRSTFGPSLSLCAISLAAACSSAPRGGDAPTGAAPAPADGADQDAAARAAILTSSDLPEPLAQPLSGDPLAVTIHRLSNGMTVYISTDRQQPRFTAWIAVRAGSRHDPASSTGLAHYLEHMLFKGTRQLGTLDFDRERPHLERIARLYDELRRASTPEQRAALVKQIDAETQKSAAYAIPNEMDQLYAALGIAEINAFTEEEQTVYVCDVPANKLEQWAAIEGDRFQNAQFRLFLPELESVYEEKNASLDSPQERVYEALLANLFPRHPYGTQTTIGTVEHLKTPAYADTVAYYRRWYVPNNMAVVLAGDIDAARALPALERAFGAMQPARLEPPAPGALPRLGGRKQVVVQAEGEQAVVIGWPTVAIGHPDRVALEVMDMLVDNSVSGLLNLELVLTQKVPRASSFGRYLGEAGFWAMSATAREGQSLDEVEKLLAGLVGKLQAGQFRQEDLDAIVLDTEIDEKEALESNEARVSRMVTAYAHRLPWPEAASHLARMRKVTRDDVVRVAKKYLGPDLVVVRRVRGAFQPPKIEKPAITAVAIDSKRESQLAREVKAMPVVPLEPEWLVEGKHYERVALPAGSMIASRNRRHDLFTVTYRFELGSKRRRLLCHALELLDRSGAEGMSPAELKRKLFAMGTAIRTDCSAEETALTVSGVDRNMEPSVQLLERWLRTAVFDDSTVEALVANRVSQRNDEMQEPQAIGQALGEYITRGADSRFLTVPSNRELKAARGSALRPLLASLPDHQHRTTYFGPRSGAEAAKVIALGARHRRVAPRDPVRYRRARGTQIFLVGRKVAQSQVRIAAPRPPLAREDRPLARLYSEYMGGNMGALVFQEIREARGLAYTAWAGYSAGSRRRDETALLAVLGTQSDKTLDALTTMLGLLRQTPLQESRFAVARGTLDEEYRASRVDPRAAPSWVQAWDDRGETSDPRPREWERLRALDPAALAEFAARAASGATLISIMGNDERFDRQALVEIGQVQIVPVNRLFGY